MAHSAILVLWTIKYFKGFRRHRFIRALQSCIWPQYGMTEWTNVGVDCAYMLMPLLYSCKTWTLKGSLRFSTWQIWDIFWASLCLESLQTPDTGVLRGSHIEGSIETKVHTYRLCWTEYFVWMGGRSWAGAIRCTRFWRVTLWKIRLQFKDWCKVFIHSFGQWIQRIRSWKLFPTS